MRETRRLFWAAVWLAIALIAVKAFYLGVPAERTPTGGWDYLRDLAAISFVDVLFAGGVWACGRTALRISGDRRGATRAVTVAVLAFSAFSCVYALASVFFFSVFGGFPTYPLLALVGDMRMLRSSVTAQVTIYNVLGLAGLPLVYLALVHGTMRGTKASSGPWWRRQGMALATVVVWVLLGQQFFAREWTTRRGRQVAENPQWVFVSSWWRAVAGEGAVRMADRFSAADLTDFEPAIRHVQGVRPRAARRPPNVILIVLESVAARWTSLNRGLYDSTPNLKAESARGLVFDNFYAHIGRSSNSLGSILLSAYPKLNFRDLTEEYPRLPGTSLASLFHDRGYRTAFFTPSDLDWAAWDTFLDRRGFGNLIDDHGLPCAELLSSWGVEDRCMLVGMLQFIEREGARPFFLMAWSQQTHHPYEPTPGVPLLNFVRETMTDEYDLERYL